MDADAALVALGSTPQGLTDAEAARRLAERGPNALPGEAPVSRIALFFKQFRSALIYILLLAAGVSLAAGHPFDAAAIAAIVAVNGVIGYAQERKAEAALAKLKALTVPTVAVRRGGRTERIEASALVPGDVVLVAEGARVPADLRLIAQADLTADESALTGESLPSEKALAAVPAEAGVADRSPMLFMGTLVVSGEGLGLVVETGERTAFGAIAHSLAVIRRERTPLERRIDRLGRTLALAAVGLSGLLFLVGLLRGLGALEMFLTAVAMAVSSIPEGLPAVLAVTLAVGVQRMARRNAVTRRLPAVETLGVVDVVCTDKTGTLTENKMTVRRAALPGLDVQVTGEGWAPEGEFLSGGEAFAPASHPELARLLRTAALCNKAELLQRDGRWAANGDPTEAALVALAAKAGFAKRELQAVGRAVAEIPFSSERKYRALLHDSDAAGREVLAVGAFETLLERSVAVADGDAERPITPDDVARFEEANRTMAGGAMRVLAIAARHAEAGEEGLDDAGVSGLTLLGLVGMIDPPRRGVAEAIADARRAGIRVIMNTGDHRETAVAIAREVGILGPEEPAEGRVLVDAEVAAMSDERLREALRHAAVFARVSPQTKVRVVQGLRALGHVVAMTGDGINDAPALKSADIGVAMGITGTDVTKEVAEMVLADDNFVSIVSAVEEGRIVYRNVKQTVAYLVMTNVGEAVTILAALALGLPLPLLPAQILWLNLVTDGFSGVALAAEKRHGDELRRPPRRRDDRILSRSLFLMTGLTAALMAGGTLLLFRWAVEADGLERARTVAFLSMALFQLWNAFSMRSATASIFTLGWRSNPWVTRGVALSVALIAALVYIPALRGLFGLAPVGWKEWALAAAVSSSVLWAVEGYKVLVRRGIIPARWN